MDRPLVRYATAIVFVVVVSAPYYLDALGALGSGIKIGDGLGILIVGAGFFLTGFFVGRWWVVPLLAVPVLITWPLGVDPQDSDGWSYAWLLLWGPILIGMPFLLAGLASRLLRDLRTPRRSPEVRGSSIAD